MLIDLNSVKVLYKMAIPGSTSAASPLFTPCGFTPPPPSSLLPAAYDVSVIVYCHTTAALHRRVVIVRCHAPSKLLPLSAAALHCR